MIRRRRACTTCPSRPTTTWSGPATGACPSGGTSRSIATTDPATFATLTSVSAIDAAVSASKAVSVPTNAFLFFQVLAGTVPAAQAADLTATAPPGPAVATAPAAPPASQVEPGTTIDNLPQRLRGHRAELPGHRHQPRLDRRPGRRRPLHGAVLLRHHGGDGPLVAPAVRRAPTRPRCRRACPTRRRRRPPVTNSQIDPLYIPVPLYSSPPVDLHAVLRA